MAAQLYEAAQRQEVDDSITPIHEEPGSIDDSVDERLKTYNLLSLDGGGIRGYWSLLALRTLMEYIAEKEEQEDERTQHSFSPQALPDNFSQVPLTEEEKKGLHDANTSEDKQRAISKTRRYFPCHYFDYICGSSTGALIAIMLGRFRMTVPDCISEYETLGQEVFGKPRFFTTLRFGVGNKTKYRANELKKVFENVTERRSEQSSHGRVKFPSERGLCRTFVTTLKTESNQKAVGTLYLIRSYDHNQRTSPDQSKMSTRKTTTHTSRSNTGKSGNVSVGERPKGRQKRSINYDNAQEFEIWEVARAATAAPFYFEPLKIPIPGASRHMLFTDGGFNYTNNPTREGTREIEEAYGNNFIGVVVSVGTARRDERPRERGLLSIIPRVRSIAQTATDPEMIHGDMEEFSAREDFPYFRLNNPGALDVEFDEWEPKDSPFTRLAGNRLAGSKTIKTISDAFAGWAMHYKTHSQLEACAAELVKRRRARVSDAAMWERYATGANFKCRIKGCKREDYFFHREQFREHLIQDHRPMPQRRLDEEMEKCRKYWRYQSPRRG